MKTKLINICLSLLFFVPAGLLAQRDFQRPERTERQERFRQKREHIEMKRIAFITEKISLTTEEAQAFWPIYNEFKEKKQEQNRRHRMLHRETGRNYEDMSEEELHKLADEDISNMMKMYKLRKEYHEKFLEVLSIQKVVMLYDAERQFRRVLLNDVRRGGHDRLNKGLR